MENNCQTLKNLNTRGKTRAVTAHFPTTSYPSTVYSLLSKNVCNTSYGKGGGGRVDKRPRSCNPGFSHKNFAQRGVITPNLRAGQCITLKSLRYLLIYGLFSHTVTPQTPDKTVIRE